MEQIAAVVTILLLLAESPTAFQMAQIHHRTSYCRLDSRHLATNTPIIHQDEDGRCIFGQKSYWDSMYSAETTTDNVSSSSVDGRRRLPSESYSWYCGYSELSPFWRSLTSPHNNPKSTSVLIAGIGNDPSPVDMYDDGYTDMVAFDYSSDGIQRAKELFGPHRRQGVKLIVADARDLPLEDATVDATLDKGTLDAIYITGKDVFADAVKELTRVTAPGGIVMCISRVIWPNELMQEFDGRYWDIIHDGNLAFAPDGEATIDLGAELYSWRRTKVEYCTDDL